MQSQSTKEIQLSTDYPLQDSFNFPADTNDESSNNQEESNKNDDAGKNIPKWPFGQEEALKDTDQQKEAVEEYIAPKGNTDGSE